MRSFIVAICLLMTNLDARAQIEYLDPALKIANLSINLAKLGIEVHEHLERLERLEAFSGELSETIEVVSTIKTDLADVKSLVRYSDLKRRSMANLSRLKSYLVHCGEDAADRVCEREFEDLQSAARSVSAEARELDVNAISIAIVASTQEMDLLLSDVSGSATWDAIIRSEYQTYWEMVLGAQNRASLVSRLDVLEAEQKQTIERGFGIPYQGPPLASLEELKTFRKWVASTGGPALTTNENLGCAVLNPTPAGAIFGSASSVDSIRSGREVFRIDPVISIEIYEGGDGNHNQAIVQGPGINTFEFYFNMRREEMRFSDKTALQTPLSVLTRTKCRLFDGDANALNNRLYQDATTVLEPLEVEINKPVPEILSLRQEIELARMAQQRLNSAD